MKKEDIGKPLERFMSKACIIGMLVTWLSVAAQAQQLTSKLERYQSADTLLLVADSLMTKIGANVSATPFSYRVDYYKVTTRSMRVEHYGTIFFRNDSIITKNFDRPAARDIFASNPVYVDSVAAVTLRTVADEKQKEWISQLPVLKGFYVQHVVDHRKNRYPANTIEFFLLSDPSGKKFGFINFGSYRLEAGTLAPQHESILKSVLDFTF
jgi:hypothetical protein